MTSQQILHIVFSFLPFVVCLFWFITFIVQFGKSDKPKRFFMAYIGTCTVLYLCHGLFFTMGIPYEMECMWTLCSLSVYPLFYGYLCRLTSIDFSARKMLPWLAPGAIVAIAKYVLPEAGIDRARLLLFMCQIVAVCYYGIRKLNAFDRQVHSVYADTENRETTDVHNLLIAIICVSILAGVANSIGKQFFGESLWLLIPTSLAFSTMLFTLSYICFNRHFTIDQLTIDQKEGEGAESHYKETEHQNSEELIGGKIEALMKEQNYFLKKDLKIGDVVKEVGSNRTYVSNYINRTFHCSFSDYMNCLRIEYAKQLILASQKDTKLTIIAEKSGFASEQSFYRNFKKFTSQTPSEWLKSQQEAKNEFLQKVPRIH